MPVETWIAFLAAASGPLLIPAPTVLVIGQLPGGGRRALNRLGGGVLIGAGLATATLRRAG